ncbi:glycosyltransferase family 2 protein [Brachybacterium halotolerans subsp. kimchii]|uniref:glycosyltransferase family A protein n=1 Tax=Brachybacterium halotolerans TaxID=2795215 RepID=UPI001E5DE82A|nr:glycosyltransferase family A protein [Brachybacterium halotolerans]UEJ81124.1 glycosyltransferase family 2 protein [Brachybacterium halotolerans subsp. kimchii]
MPSEESARVTLVIPSYDRPEYLEQAVASAQAQTWPALDIVVCDDGSTDPEQLRLLERLERDGIAVRRFPHRGVSATLNGGIGSSDARYFLCLGDDDLIEPPYVEEAVKVAEADPRIGVVYCRADVFGAMTGPWELPDFDIGSILIDNQIFATALFRREDWLAVGGYDETMTEGREDHDFLLRILGLGRDVHRLEGTYFHYRQHDRPSLNAVTGRSTETKARVYATMLRNNQSLYLEHAEEFWLHFFRRLEEARDLRLRYRHLEALRARFPRSYGVLRTVRRSAEALTARRHQGRR